MDPEVVEFLKPIGDKLPDVLLVILGFLLGVIPSWWAKKMTIRNHWANLSVELVACKDLAETYLRDHIMCPLYRLPTVAFQTSFPNLIALGQLTEEEINVLSRFSTQVQNLNRGLDNASNIGMINTPQAQEEIKKEFDRNRLYATDITIPANSVGETHFSRALKVINEHR